MSANTVTINFNNATLTSTSSQITVTGGSFCLSANDPLSMAGTVSFSSLYVTSGAVDFNVQPGTKFTAQIVLPVATSGGTPLITVSNFSGTVTVTWPTPTGLQT